MSLASQQETMELLANPIRLQIICSLQAQGGRLEVSRLAELLAEPGKTPASDARVRRRLEQTLLRTHIPIMQRLGVLQYFEKQKIVMLRELPSSMTSQLESMLLLLFDLLRGGKSL